MRDWLVAADDRTGALEVAAELAVVVGPVTVTVRRAPDGDGVVDLGSRAMARGDAAEAAVAVDLSPSEWTAHKIDSTLRGNWAAELRARQAVQCRPVLVIAAWPLMGRTCRGGVVHVHGEPVERVRDHLPEVELLDDAAAVAEWQPAVDGVAAVDVSDTADLLAVAAVAARRDLLVAGPAGAIGAVFAARHPRVLDRAHSPRLESPVLVVCGSATQVSRVQVARLAAARPEVEILSAPPADGDLSPEHAAEVAGRAVERFAHAATVVILGGDTAAAVLGDRPRLVGGYAAPGMPWSRDSSGNGPLVITKAGGFGGPDALVDLLTDQTG